MNDEIKIAKRMVLLVVTFVFLLFAVNSVSALFIGNGTTFDDSCWNYTANRDFSVSSINVSTCNFQIDGVPFCSWANMSYFDTLRDCNVTGNYTYAFYFYNSSDNLIYNNTIVNVNYSFYMTNTSLNNLFYYNSLTNVFTFYVFNVVTGGNYFNTSVLGASHGNYYDDILSWDIIDTDFDGYGDSGSDYPYNSSQTKWGGNGSDWGPMGAKTLIVPNVTGLQIVPLVANQSDLINITVNITDDLAVSGAFIEVSYPLGGNQNFTMSNSSASFFNLSFLDTFETGIYFIRIHANDSVNNFNSSETGNFTINVAPGYGNSTTNITVPANDSLYGINVSFDVYVNVSAVNGNLTGCNVTLGVGNSSVLNITSTNPLPINHVVNASSNLTWFNVTGIGAGSSNISATTSCSFGSASNDAIVVGVIPLNISVYLVSPLNGTSSVSVNQLFTCNATTGAGLNNLTLYVWNASDALINQTTDVVSGTFNETSFNLTNMEYGNYTWNCFGVGGSYSAWGSMNNTLEIKNLTSGWVNVTAPEGIFEPYNGTTYFGTHVNRMSIVFDELTILPSEVLSCDVQMANGSIRVVNETGINLAEGYYTLNYTLNATIDPYVYHPVQGYTPWIMKNCSVLSSGSAVYYENSTDWAQENKTSRIHVHEPGYWDVGDILKAVSCINNPEKYFNNSEKCTASGDIAFALNMMTAAPNEDSCYNNVGVGCGFSLCRGLTFPSCRAIDYHVGKSPFIDDPNGLAHFNESVGARAPEIYYTRYVNSSGAFKLRFKQSGLVALGWTVTIVNVSNASVVNIYGSDVGNGGLFVNPGPSPGTVNINYENTTAGAYTGDLDFVINVSFANLSMLENGTSWITIGFGGDNNVGSEINFPITYDAHKGYLNTNESEGNDSIYSVDAGNRCGDEANNDFDYLLGTWTNSFDCFDYDCHLYQGDDSETNEFWSGVTGLCNFGTELNCSDHFDNDYDYRNNTDYTDCHDADCFLDASGTGECPAVELICNDSANNDWDYTNTEADVSAKVGNNGTKYQPGFMQNLTDCEDLDCDGQVGGASGELCSWGWEANCSDNFDNDVLQMYDCVLGSPIGDTTQPNIGIAEYDCAQFCRVTNSSNENGTLCSDGLDNDWDAMNTSGTYGGIYNDTHGSGIDCRWGGYFGIGTNYRPDEDCNNTVMASGVCNLANELNCTDSFDNDYDNDAALMPSPGWSAEPGYYLDYFNVAYSTDADFDDYDCADELVVMGVNESTNASWCFDGVDNDLDVYFFNGTGYQLNSSGDVGIDCDDLDCEGIENPLLPGTYCSAYEYNASAGAPYNSPLRCEDTLDNDGDLATDCADSDCAGQFGACDLGACKYEENITWNSCFDGSDNDLGGGTDCADTDCEGMFGSASGGICQTGAGAEDTNFECSDGLDNNAAGGIDCADTSDNCDDLVGGIVNGSPVYCRNSEILSSDCRDGFDNDGDGDIDCDDNDCNTQCGFATISGTAPISLPQTVGPITLRDVAIGVAYIDSSTSQVRQGENYTLRLIGVVDGHDTSWTIGTVTSPFNKTAYINATVGITGPDAGTFSLIETSVGYRIDETAPHVGGYDISFNVQSAAVMSSYFYELTYFENSTLPASVSISNNITSQVNENVVPVAQIINFSSPGGIDFGGQWGIRANISDNNLLGRCDFVVYGALNTSTNELDCKFELSPTSEGMYYVNVTPIDYYSNIGSSISRSHNLNIRPTGSSTTTDDEFYRQSDLVSFTANFNVIGSDTLGVGQVYAKNASMNSTQAVYLGECVVAGSSCSNTTLNVSSLGDGVYSIYANITETTEGDVIESLSKGIFVCTGINGICGFTDFDANNISDKCVLTPPSVINLTSLYNPFNQTLTTNLSANVTDGGVVAEVLAQVTYPDLTFENFTMTGPVGDIYNLIFGSAVQTWQTGLYWFRIIATDDQGAVNDSEISNFTVLVWGAYGNSTTNITWPNASSNSYYTFDLFNVNVSVSANANMTNCSVELDITDPSVINFSTGQSAVHNIGNLTNTSAINESWILQSIGNGTIEVTTTTYCYRGGSSYDKITLYSFADLIPPNVTNLTGYPLVINQTDSVLFNASVVDNRAVDEVFARITYPDTLYTDYSMTNVSDIYSLLFSDTQQTGQFEVRIFADDPSENLNSSEAFNITSLVWPGFGNSTTNITTPADHSAYNASDVFVLNATLEGVGIMVNCSAKIDVNTTVLTVGGSSVITLGNLTNNQTNVSWSITAKNNITIASYRI